MILHRLHLTTEERQTLEGWQQKYKKQSSKLRQVQIVLNSDEATGRRPASELAPVLGVSTRTIERVRCQFCQEGIGMFEAKARKTRSDKKIDGRVEAHLTALLCQSPPDDEPRWKLQVLAQRLVELQLVAHISTTMVRRLLKKNALKPFHGPKQWVIPAEQSATFVCQMEQVLDLYEQPYDPAYPVVCLNESPKQLLEYETFAAADGQRHRDSEYVRRGVVDLFVATEPLRGWRQLPVEADHKAATWVQVVATLLDTTYRTATKVRWVMDNLSTHKPHFFYAHFPPAVAQAYLRRMEIIYTPAHGSWLNMAELEFSVLSRQALDQPFSSAEQVRQVVDRWVTRQNAKAQPRNWQFTTADARIKLAKLYPTI